MSLTITFYGEISCPWCLIALHRLDNVLARDFPELPVTVHHEPVILTKGIPEEGISLAEIFRKKHGDIDVGAAHARPEAEARSAGITLELARQPRIFDTTAAHTVIRLSPVASQHALAVALTDAHFLQGLEMGNLEAIAEIASLHGFGRSEALAAVRDPAELEATRQAAKASRSRGVMSVPLIVFPSGHSLQTSSDSDLSAALTRET